MNSRRLLPCARVLLFFLFATSVFIRSGSAQQESLSELKQREQKIKEVSVRVLPATVCVTDGIGFGSGVVVSKDGVVLTAGHVLLTEGKKFVVIFPDGREVAAERLGKNLPADAGMIRITDAGEWPFVELGETSSVKRGDWCIGLGHSGGYVLGRQPPVRVGRILNTNERRIVSDCTLIGGDSGGPMFDLDGKLIGIHSSIGTSIAENRHVAIDVFKTDWDRLASGETWGKLVELSKARPNGPLLGIKLDKNLDEVARVQRVSRGTPAWRAGLQEGDLIVSVDDESIIDWQHLIDIVADHEPDDVLKIQVERAKQLVDVSVTLTRRDE
jgi:serine protease Do